MENEIQINTPVDSVIAAYGTSSRRRFLPLFLGLLTGLGFVLFIIGFFWLLAGHVGLPTNLTFLGIAAPRTLAQALSSEEIQRLPLNWRSQIDERSRWPSLFGAAREEQGWRFFVIAPRWSFPDHVNAPFQAVRAVGVLGLEPDQENSSHMTYLSWWGKTLRHPSAQGQFEVHPQTILPSFFKASDQIQGHVFRDHLETNLASQITEASATIQGDLFLQLDPHGTTTGRTALLQALDLDDRSLSMPHLEPYRLIIQYSPSSTINLIQLETAGAMSSSTKLGFLAALGFSKKSVQTMPDGSLLIERRLPSEKELKTTSSYTTPVGTLELTDTLFRLERASSTPTTVSPCNKGTVVARFSPQALRELLIALDLSFLTIDQGIQFYQDRGRISLCQEI